MELNIRPSPKFSNFCIPPPCKTPPGWRGPRLRLHWCFLPLRAMSPCLSSPCSDSITTQWLWSWCLLGHHFSCVLPRNLPWSGAMTSVLLMGREAPWRRNPRGAVVLYWWDRRLRTRESGRVLSSVLALTSPLISLGRIGHLSSPGPLRFRRAGEAVWHEIQGLLYIITHDKFTEVERKRPWLLMAVQLQEVKFPELQQAALCWSFMSFPFNSTYSSYFYIMFYWNPFSTLML